MIKNFPIKLQQHGLTLIEVLMAILLFGSGIVVILSIIIQNIGLAQRIQDKTTATMLAKEAIEMFYSYKDTNIDKGEYWDALGPTSYIQPDESSFFCIEKLSDGTISVEPNCNADQNQQLLEYVGNSSNSDGIIFKRGSSTSSDRKVSRFKRYCQFKKISGTDPIDLDRQGGHLALVISCTVESASQSIASRKTSVTLSSMIGQNRE